MNTGFLITARLKSTRLPKKLLLKIHEKEIIRWMIKRLKLSDHLSLIILCTSTNPQDDPLVKIAEEEGIKSFRGSEDDVLERLNEACNFYRLDYALNITADCPLVSIEYIPITIKKFKETNADLINCLDLPHGFFSYGLRPYALREVCETKKEEKTEVWGKYFINNNTFSVVDMRIPENLKRPYYRLTLDYPEDYEFFKAVFAHFGQDTYKKDMKNIIHFLDNNPQIVNINQNCILKYQQRWDTQNKTNE